MFHTCFSLIMSRCSFNCCCNQLTTDLMVFSFLLRCVSTVVGAFFPAFYTFKTLAKPNQRAQVWNFSDYQSIMCYQIYWLKYWAVFGAALAVEFVLDSLFLTYLIPGYEVRVLYIHCIIFSFGTIFSFPFFPACSIDLCRLLCQSSDQWSPVTLR